MRPSLWEADRDGEWSGRLRPHSTPQQTWFSLIHLLIYSFIQIVFVEHLPCVRSQGSEVGKSQALLSGCSRSGGGDSSSVICTLIARPRSVGAGGGGQRRPVIAKLRPEGYLENKSAEVEKGFQAQEDRGRPVLSESSHWTNPHVQ